MSKQGKPDRTAFGAESTAEQVLEGLDLTGKTAIVTGASGGLGVETVRALATAGAAVTLAARDAGKAGAVAESIVAACPEARLEVRELSLDRPESVRAFARAWLEDHASLQILVNNAGVMACPLMRTAEGWEMQLATNHIGHFLLTARLSPALVAGAPARVVNVSSAGHRFSAFVFDDPHCERRPYDKWEAYGQSKTANVLFSVELDRRLRDRGVRAFAVHPGAIITELGRHMQKEDMETLLARAPGGDIRWKKPEAGAATSVWAATAPELEGRGGLYLEDCGLAVPRETPGQAGGFDAWAVDPAAARKLWAWTEETLGERFETGA